MLRRLALGISLVALLAAAPAAQAATLNVSGGTATLQTTGTLDQTVELGSLSGGFSIRVTSQSTDVTGTGCSPTGTVGASGVITCDTTVTALAVVFGTGDDTLTQASAVTVPITATGGAGRDNLEGGSGADTLDGGAGTDIITGGAGNDTIIGGLDHDVVDGGTNTATGDTFSYNDGRAGPVTVTLAASATPNDGGTADGTPEDLNNFENVTGGRGDDTLTGTTGANRIFGGDGDDTLRGDDGNDDLRGDDGNDRVDGGFGADVLRGGEGTDAVTYENRTNPVTVTLSPQTANSGNADDGPAGARDTILGAEFEAVIGGSDGDTLSVGNASVGRRLEGRAGNDTLNGGSASGADVLVGGTGIDDLNGNGGDDTLEGDSGSDLLDGGTGTDRVSYVDHDGGVSVTLDGVRNDGNAAEDGGVRDSLTSIEDITGSPQSDTLFGDSNPNDIDGGSGNDVIRAGSDVVPDVLDGGPGLDTMDYGDRSAAVTASLDGAPNEGGGAVGDRLSAFEGLTGGAGADTLSSTIAATLNGSGGADRITGSGAADVLDGGSGSDTINGGAGVDTIRGGDDDDSIDARDSGLDSVDCGNGAADNALTDSIDTRANCELGAPPAATPTPTPTPSPTPTPTPTPKPKKPLKTFAVTVFFHFPDDPTSVTLFDTFTISNVPKGAKVVGNCLTRRGKSCKGSLKSKFTLKQKKRRTIKAKKFTQKRYPAGSKLEVVVSKKGFKNQIKTVTIRNGKQPGLTTRCQKPGAKKRTQC